MSTAEVEKNDIRVLREWAQKYAEVAARPIQDARRKLWSDHNGLQRTPPPVLVTPGMDCLWCREMFSDAAMQCRDPFYREHERTIRMLLLQDEIGDDFIIEPWITQPAVKEGSRVNFWGVSGVRKHSDMESGAYKEEPPIKKWSDVAKLKPTPHRVDEAATAVVVERIQNAIGDIVPINVDRSPHVWGLAASISAALGHLRGIEQLMYDMYESPGELHNLLAFMRDGILAAQMTAEKAGDLCLTTSYNQQMRYSKDLEWPQANSGARTRKQLWAFCAAQELTLVSPEMHEEFMLNYQLPLLEPWGLVAYGCCENLTNKIDMLRNIPNLRAISVTPTADVWKCAEQIGRDYVISWRPNPADMVCLSFDEPRIRRIIADGLKATRNGYAHILLKDIQTVQGDVSRLARWVRIVRDEIGKF